MKYEHDFYIYMMAAEKMTSMLSTIEQTMSFMEEYKVKPDAEVKKALAPMIDQMKRWINYEDTWAALPNKPDRREPTQSGLSVPIEG